MKSSKNDLFIKFPKKLKYFYSAALNTLIMGQERSKNFVMNVFLLHYTILGLFFHNMEMFLGKKIIIPEKLVLASLIFCIVAEIVYFMQIILAIVKWQKFFKFKTGTLVYKSLSTFSQIFPYLIYPIKLISIQAIVFQSDQDSNNYQANYSFWKIVGMSTMVLSII